jgi:hypothetical protein
MAFTFPLRSINVAMPSLFCTSMKSIIFSFSHTAAGPAMALAAGLSA